MKQISKIVGCLSMLLVTILYILWKTFALTN